MVILELASISFFFFPSTMILALDVFRNYDSLSLVLTMWAPLDSGIIEDD